VNAGLALAIFAVIQLILADLAGRPLESLDDQLFAEGVRTHQPLGIAGFFDANQPSPDLGKTRVTEVLRYTRLGSSARSTLVALLVSFIGCCATLAIIALAEPEPNYKQARLISTGIGALLTLGFFILLLIVVAIRKLVTKVPDEDGIPARPRLRGAIRRYRVRVASTKVLTPYLTVALVANAIVIWSAYAI
jgi:hypothetical protein